jgi:hypothetical protein
MRDLKWSPSEKEIARKAFEQAFEREMAAVIAKVKKEASEIKEPDDLWKLEEYLTKRRQEIGDKYDYRYSVMPTLFGRLIQRRPSERSRVERHRRRQAEIRSRLLVTLG